MARSLAYRRLLVPIADNPESEQAMDFACRLAGRGASIVAVSVVEVPPLLPLNAHMTDDETKSHGLLERASAIADSYGVTISARVVRAREPAHAIVHQAVAHNVELIVIGAPRALRGLRRSAVFGSTVEHVLKRAPCRVMVIGSPAVAAVRHAAA